MIFHEKPVKLVLKAILPILLLFIFHGLQANEIVVQKGVLDLRKWDFQKDGIVRLKGSWEFYPQKYYNPKKFLSSNGIKPESKYIQVPGMWTKYRGGNFGTPVFAYGTYRMKIILDQKKYCDGHGLALDIPQSFSKYKLWIDTTLIVSLGSPEKNKSSQNPVIYPVIKSLAGVHSDTIPITIQVTNYLFHGFGGIRRPIEIGLYRQLVEKTRLYELGYLAGAIFSLTLGVYFLFLSFLTKEWKINLLFGIASMFVVLRFFVDRQSLIMLLMPDFDPFLRFKLLFLSIDFVPVTLWVVHLFFPDIISKKIVYPIVGSYALYSILLFITPFPFDGHLFFYFLPVTLMVSFYAIGVSGFAYWKKRKLAAVFFYGFLLSTIIFVSNLYVNFVHSDPDIYMPVGQIIILILIGYAITLRIARSRKNELQLIGKLQVMNEEMEHLVEKRTKSLNEANESLKKLNSSKDRFISILSHDLRNPLMVIIGLSKRLMKSTTLQSEEKIVYHAGLINEAAVASYKLVENILDWSLIGLNKKRTIPQRLILRNLVENEFSLLKSEAASKDIELINDVDPQCIVYADQRMTAGILRNLLTNGIKFTKDMGRVKVKTSHPVNFWNISVEDNGIGMNPSEVEQLFRIDKKFYKYGTNHEPGSGYGLVLVKEFVESNGGKISISSEKGVGTTVSFTLPVWSETSDLHNIYKKN